MSFENKISTFREIYDLSMKGESDEMIAKKLNMKVWSVYKIRSSVNGGKQSINIFQNQGKKVVNNESNTTVSFSIPLNVMEELGLTRKGNYRFTGKVIGKNKVEISFKTVA